MSTTIATTPEKRTIAQCFECNKKHDITDLPERPQPYKCDCGGHTSIYTSTILPPDELEELKKRTAPEQKSRFNLTREEYLQARTKRTRMQLIKDFDIEPHTLKGFLNQWGLAESAVEREEIDKLRPAKSEEKQKDESKSKPATLKPQLTKEYVQAMFERGMTAAKIELELGMKRNGLFYHLKKWDIRSPHGKGESVQVTESNPDSKMSDPTPEQGPIANEPKTIESVPESYIVLQFPIINGPWHPIEQRVKVYEELNEFSTEIESSEMNRARAASELFDLIQAYIGLIRADLADLLPGKTVNDQLQRFMEHHLQLHREKIDRFAAERGWKLG